LGRLNARPEILAGVVVQDQYASNLADRRKPGVVLGRPQCELDWQRKPNINPVQSHDTVKPRVVWRGLPNLGRLLGMGILVTILDTAPE
jgi:hypothetical protein